MPTAMGSKGEGRGGQRWLLSAHTSGENNSETCRRSTVAVLTISFFNGGSYWGPLQSRTLGTTVASYVVDTGSPYPSSLFLPSLYIAALLVSG